MLTCRSLRGATLMSGLLLVAAWVVEGLATYGLLPPVTTGYTGLMLMLVAAAILAVTVALSLLPANAQRLAGCEH